MDIIRYGVLVEWLDLSICFYGDMVTQRHERSSVLVAVVHGLHGGGISEVRYKVIAIHAHA